MGPHEVGVFRVVDSIWEKPYTIQAATIMGFIGSSYWIVLRYTTPAVLSERLRRD